MCKTTIGMCELVKKWEHNIHDYDYDCTVAHKNLANDNSHNKRRIFNGFVKYKNSSRPKADQELINALCQEKTGVHDVC